MEVQETQDSREEMQDPVSDINQKGIPTQEPVISLSDSPTPFALQERTIFKSDKGHDDSPPKSPDSAIGQTPDSSPTFPEEKSITVTPVTKELEEKNIVSHVTKENVEDQGVQDSKENSPSNLFLGDEQAEDERVSSDSSSSSSIVIVNQEELAQEQECVPEEGGNPEQQQVFEFEKDKGEEVKDDMTQEEDAQVATHDMSSQPSLQETSMVIVGESMLQEIRSDDFQNEDNEELKVEDISVAEEVHEEVAIPTMEPVVTMEAIPAVETISRVDAVPTMETVSVETGPAVEDVVTRNTIEAVEMGPEVETGPSVEIPSVVNTIPDMEAPPVAEVSVLEKPIEQQDVPSALVEAVEDEIIDRVKEEDAGVRVAEEGEEEVSEPEMVVEATMQFPLTSKDQETKKEDLEEVVEDKVTVKVKQEISAPAVQKEATPSGCESDVEDNIEEQHNSPSSAVASPAAASLARLGTNLQLPSTVTRLESPAGSVVFLVGTAHFSLESQEDVAMTIREVRPDIVVVELCKARTAILQLDEETILQESRNLDFKKVRMIMKQHGKIQGLLYWLLLSVSAHITKQLGMAPGGEFRAAFAEARKSSAGCIIQLGDRPIHITLSRALASLSIWHKVKLAWHILTSKEPISKEEVEKCKQNDFLEEMLAEMTGEFPAISEVFVKERDIYLTRSLQAAAQPVPDATSPTGYSPRVVVGVVGIGHVQGIVQRWGTVTEADIPPIMRIPPPSLSSRILTVTFKVSVYSLIGYGVYKLLPSAAKEGIHSSFRTLVTTVSGKQTTL